MHLQTVPPRSPAPPPLSLAVPLPSDPPRRPWPRPLDPRRLRFPDADATVHCPGPRLPSLQPCWPALEPRPC